MLEEVEELQRHTRQTCVNADETADMQNVRTTRRGFVIYNVSLGKLWCICTAKTDVRRLCVGINWTRGHCLETSKNNSFGNQDLSSHSEETKKVRFLEFLVSKKNW